MSVIVVGIEQRRSPLDLLERVAVTESDLPKALGRLRDKSNLSEAVILSTWPFGSLPPRAASGSRAARRARGRGCRTVSWGNAAATVRQSTCRRRQGG